MVKPARLGQLGRDDARPRPRRSGPPPSTTAFRYDDLALVERYLAGARDLEVAVIGNEPDALELYGPGEIVAGHEFYDYAAKYTPGLSETSTGAEVDARAAGASILKLARDAYRAIGCEGFARVDFLLAGDRARRLRDQHDPGLHADQPVPDAARRGRLRLRRRLPPGRRPRARARGRAGPPPADRRGPAALMGGRSPMRQRRDAARCAPPCRAPGRQRRSAASRRARSGAGVGGPDAGARRRAARAGRRARRPLRRDQLVGAFAPARAPRSSGVTWTPQDAVLRGARHPRRPEPVHARHRPSSRPRLGDASRRSAARRSPSRCPTRSRVDVAERERAARLAGRARDRYLVDEDGLVFGGSATTAARGRRDARRSSTTSAPASAALAVGADARPGRSSTPRAGSARCARPTSAAAAPGSSIQLDDEHGLRRSTADPVGWSAVFGFYTPTLRTTDLIPGQVRLLRSLLAGPRGRRPAGDPRRRPQRHLRPAARTPSADRPAKPKPQHAP